MSSCFASPFKRFMFRTFPFSLYYKKCPEGNYHPFWDRLCFCRCGEHSGDWHGGIYDFKTKKEYQHCQYCAEEQQDKYKQCTSFSPCEQGTCIKSRCKEWGYSPIQNADISIKPKEDEHE